MARIDGLKRRLILRFRGFDQIDRNRDVFPQERRQPVPGGLFSVIHRDRAADIVLVLEETFGRSLLIRITLTAAMM